MRVLKNPSANTLAICWASLDKVPAGIETEEMTQAELAAWLASQPAIVQPEPVPESVSPAQLREALIDAGISLESITAALNSIPDAKAKAKALARWEYATAIERGHPLITQMAGALKLTPAQVDDIFRSASRL